MNEQTVRLIEAATTFVQEHMATYDDSHDYSHVRRVLALAKLILEKENASLPRPSIPHHADGDSHSWEAEPSMGLSEPIVVLGALLHDINDRKYYDQAKGPVNLVDLLTRWGADKDLAGRVEGLCQGVSYSTEIRDPMLVANLIQEIPELAVVQDADRLDAIGAVGIARCFTFGASRRRGLSQSIDHFEEKLVQLERLMKTRTGREMARVRTERVREFMRWWNDETTGCGSMDGILDAAARLDH